MLKFWEKRSRKRRDDPSTSPSTCPLHGNLDSSRATSLCFQCRQINPGSKAWQAGVREGDELEAINDKTTSGLSPNESSDLIRSSLNCLRLTLRRDDRLGKTPKMFKSSKSIELNGNHTTMQSTTCEGAADTFGNTNTSGIVWRQFPKPFEKYNSDSGAPCLRHIKAPGTRATTVKNDNRNSRTNPCDSSEEFSRPCVSGDSDSGGVVDGRRQTGNASPAPASDVNDNFSVNIPTTTTANDVRPMTLPLNENSTLKKHASDAWRSSHNSNSDVIRVEVSSSLETDVTSLQPLPSSQNGGLYVKPIDKSRMILEQGAFYSAFQKGVRKVMGGQDGDSLRCEDLKFNNDWDECDGSFESWQRRLVQKARLLKEPAVKKMVSTSKTVRDNKPRSDGDVWRRNAQAELEELKREANKQWISLQNESVPRKAIIRRRYDMQEQRNASVAILLPTSREAVRYSINLNDVKSKDEANALYPSEDGSAAKTRCAVSVPRSAAVRECYDARKQPNDATDCLLPSSLSSSEETVSHPDDFNCELNPLVIIEEDPPPKSTFGSFPEECCNSPNGNTDTSLPPMKVIVECDTNFEELNDGKALLPTDDSATRMTPLSPLFDLSDSPTTSGCSCTSCSSVLCPSSNVIDNPLPPSSIDHPPAPAFFRPQTTTTLGLSVRFSDERKLSVVLEDESPPSSSSSSAGDSLLLSSDGDDSVIDEESDSDDPAVTAEISRSQFMNVRSLPPRPRPPPRTRPGSWEKVPSLTVEKICHVTATITSEDKTPDASNKSGDGKSVPSSPLSITVSSKKVYCAVHRDRCKHRIHPIGWTPLPLAGGQDTSSSPTTVALREQVAHQLTEQCIAQLKQACCDVWKVLSPSRAVSGLATRSHDSPPELPSTLPPPPGFSDSFDETWSFRTAPYSSAVAVVSTSQPQRRDSRRQVAPLCLEKAVSPGAEKESSATTTLSPRRPTSLIGDGEVTPCSPRSPFSPGQHSSPDSNSLGSWWDERRGSDPRRRDSCSSTHSNVSEEWKEKIRKYATTVQTSVCSPLQESVPLPGSEDAASPHPVPIMTKASSTGTHDEDLLKLVLDRNVPSLPQRSSSADTPSDRKREEAFGPPPLSLTAQSSSESTTITDVYPMRLERVFITTDEETDCRDAELLRANIHRLQVPSSKTESRQSSTETTSDPFSDRLLDFTSLNFKGDSRQSSTEVASETSTDIMPRSDSSETRSRSTDSIESHSNSSDGCHKTDSKSDSSTLVVRTSFEREDSVDRPAAIEALRALVAQNKDDDEDALTPPILDELTSLGRRRRSSPDDDMQIPSSYETLTLSETNEDDTHADVTIEEKTVVYFEKVDTTGSKDGDDATQEAKRKQLVKADSWDLISENLSEELSQLIASFGEGICTKPLELGKSQSLDESGGSGGTNGSTPKGKGSFEEGEGSDEAKKSKREDSVEQEDTSKDSVEKSDVNKYDELKLYDKKGDEQMTSPKKEGDLKVSSRKEDEHKTSPKRDGGLKVSSKKDEEQRTSPKKESGLKVSTKKDEEQRSSPKRESGLKPTTKKEEEQRSSPKRESGLRVGTKKDEEQRSSPKKESGLKVGTKKDDEQRSSSKKESGLKVSAKKDAEQRSSPKKESGLKVGLKKEEELRASPKKESGLKSSSMKDEEQRSSPKKESGLKVGIKKDEEQRSSPNKENPQFTIVKKYGEDIVTEMRHGVMQVGEVTFEVTIEDLNCDKLFDNKPLPEEPVTLVNINADSANEDEEKMHDIVEETEEDLKRDALESPKEKLAAIDKEAAKEKVIVKENVILKERVIIKQLTKQESLPSEDLEVSQNDVVAIESIVKTDRSPPHIVVLSTSSSVQTDHSKPKKACRETCDVGVQDERSPFSSPSYSDDFSNGTPGSHVSAHAATQTDESSLSKAMRFREQTASGGQGVTDVSLQTDESETLDDLASLKSDEVASLPSEGAVTPIPDEEAEWYPGEAKSTPAAAEVPSSSPRQSTTGLPTTEPTLTDITELPSAYLNSANLSHEGKVETREEEDEDCTDTLILAEDEGDLPQSDIMLTIAYSVGEKDGSTDRTLQGIPKLPPPDPPPKPKAELLVQSSDEKDHLSPSYFDWGASECEFADASGDSAENSPKNVEDVPEDANEAQAIAEIRKKRLERKPTLAEEEKYDSDEKPTQGRVAERRPPSRITGLHSNIDTANQSSVIRRLSSTDDPLELPSLPNPDSFPIDPGDEANITSPTAQSEWPPLPSPDTLQPTELVDDVFEYETESSSRDPASWPQLSNTFKYAYLGMVPGTVKQGPLLAGLPLGGQERLLDFGGTGRTKCRASSSPEKTVRTSMYGTTRSSRESSAKTEDGTTQWSPQEEDKGLEGYVLGLMSPRVEVEDKETQSDVDEHDGCPTCKKVDLVDRAVQSEIAEQFPLSNLPTPEAPEYEDKQTQAELLRYVPKTSPRVYRYQDKEIQSDLISPCFPAEYLRFMDLDNAHPRDLDDPYRLRRYTLPRTARTQILQELGDRSNEGDLDVDVEGTHSLVELPPDKDPQTPTTPTAPLCRFPRSLATNPRTRALLVDDLVGRGSLSDGEEWTRSAATIPRYMGKMGSSATPVTQPAPSKAQVLKELRGGRLENRKAPKRGRTSSTTTPTTPTTDVSTPKDASGGQTPSDHPLTRVARGSPTTKETRPPPPQPAAPTAQASTTQQETGVPPSHTPQSLDVIPTTTFATSGTSSKEEGVWSPGKAVSYPSASLSCSSLSEAAKEVRVPASKDDSTAHIPPIWKPFGQSHSNAEQPHFRSIRLDKMTLKENQGQPQQTPSSVTTPTPPPPPSSESMASWQTTQTHVYSRIQTLEQTMSSSSSTTTATTATTTVTTPTTQTSPPSGAPSQLSPPFQRINGCSNLPRSQSPTITLLQKAREGHIPKVASYIEKPAETPYSSSFPRVNDSLFRVKSAEIHDNYRKVHLEPIKHQGIGPTTPQGLPIGLRTADSDSDSDEGIKEENKGEWYKKMYKSLHRIGDSSEDDFIMVKYRHRGRIPYSTTGYMSEPEPERDALRTYSKYATLDRRRPRFDEFADHRNRTMPPTKSKSAFSSWTPPSAKYSSDVYRNQPKKIEDYEPGHSSIAEREAKLDEEVVKVSPDIQPMATLPPTIPSTHGTRHNPQLDRPAPSYVFKDGYESDSTLVYHKHGSERPDPMDQRLWYRDIQRGGDIPLAGFRRPVPDRPKDSALLSPTAAPERRLARSWSTESAPAPLDLSMLPPVPAPPPKVPLVDANVSDSPHRYNETQVNIHYKAPVRELEKEYIEEDELRVKQEEMMKQFYEQERRKKYLQELNDIESRRHSDNFTPGQKSPIPLNRYDQFDGPASPQPRTKTPEPKTVARARYKFVAQSARELSFNKGDVIYVTRCIDKNWYEGEHHGMIGLFPVNYVEIIPHDSVRMTPKKLTEGLAKAKYHFRAQTSLELPLVKGELIVLTRRVDHNWYMGRIGGREGIVPVSYVEVMREPGDNNLKPTSPTPKPTASPIRYGGRHVISRQQRECDRATIMNGSASSPHTQSFNPPSYYNQKLNTYQSPYATMRRYVPNRPPEPTYAEKKQPVNQSLHIDTHSEPVPYRALYDYQPQNEDELELREGDTVFVMEKCDDGWYVGSSLRTGFFGTFPGNYVERL